MRVTCLNHLSLGNGEWEDALCLAIILLPVHHTLLINKNLIINLIINQNYVFLYTSLIFLLWVNTNPSLSPEVRSSPFSLHNNLHILYYNKVNYYNKMHYNNELIE